MAKGWFNVLEKVDDYRWRLPTGYKTGMRVPGLIFADEPMLRSMAEDEAIEQVANVAFLPGIVGHSLAMPDIHWGYGFPIGGVAAMRLDDGVVSPGGVGFDINCGTRLLRTNLMEDEVRPVMKPLVDQLFRDVPSGLGAHGPLRVSNAELDEIMVRGAAWMVERGYGTEADLDATESRGAIPGASPATVSQRARQRGHEQLGTLGAGNHFLEVQAVEAVYDEAAARAFGLDLGVGQVVVFFHCGSRGFGHQVCQDYLDVMEKAARKYHISLPDKQLACAPIKSKEGKDYLAAMAAAANFAWANRQAIAHWTRQAVARVLGRSVEEIGLQQVYDVAHNIAKIEEHRVDARRTRLCVHRKGATRAFPAGHPEVPTKYRDVGQPVLVPGDMGRYSYLCVGTEQAMAETWGSTCHGAGRMQSRGAAKRALKGIDIAARLQAQGIVIRAQNRALLAEEASEAYKDVADVVEVLDRAGIARKVARMRPLGVIKG
ncbi:MAG: RtcB family protein [Dehalococcoidia bacterium]|nr:RtcB family protein [Dehalococcoidia bacterium]